jgi:hypothetical protein
MRLSLLLGTFAIISLDAIRFLKVPGIHTMFTSFGETGIFIRRRDFPHPAITLRIRFRQNPRPGILQNSCQNLGRILVDSEKM